MKTIRVAALAALVAGASVALAGPASAEPLQGLYDAMVTGGNVLNVGKHIPWTFTPCGPDCAQRSLMSGDDVEFHLQGNTWTGVHGAVTETIDASSLSATTHQPDGTITWQLQKP